MSKPNLLYYFPRKQNIYVTVLEDTLATWLEPFEHIDPDGDPLEELRRYIALKLEMSAKSLKLRAFSPMKFYTALRQFPTS